MPSVYLGSKLEMWRKCILLETFFIPTALKTMCLTPRRTSTHASSIRYPAARLLAARGYACLSVRPSVRDKTGHTHTRWMTHFRAAVY